MPPTTEHWQMHQSHLSMLCRCGEQYRRRYIEGEIIPPGIAAVTGSGAHAAISTDLGRKIETGELAPVEELRDTARDYVDAEFRRGAYRLLPEEKPLGKKHWRDESVDWAIRFAGCHHAELAPTLTPSHAERKWVVKLKGFPCDLAGMLDVQETRPDGTITVRDTKTGGKVNDASTSLQLTMYAMAVRVLDGTMPALCTLDNVVRRAPKKNPHAELVVSETQRTEEDFKTLLRRVETAVRLIEAGVFPPANPDDWWCSERFCGFYNAGCPYVRGRRAYAVGGRP